MVALEAPTLPSYKLCGLRVLFKLLNDPAGAGTLKHKYDFDAANFAALTAKHEIFAISHAP
jgi:hypothetical protein